MHRLHAIAFFLAWVVPIATTSARAEELASHTVLVYINHDGSLTGIAAPIVEQIRSAIKSNSRINAIVLHDPYNPGHSDPTAAATREVYLRGRLAGEHTRKWAGRGLDAVQMGSADFVRAMLFDPIREDSRLRAQKYVLVVLGHGAGWLPAFRNWEKKIDNGELDFGFDLQGDYSDSAESAPKALAVHDIKNMAEGLPDGARLESVIFHSCYMGSIEVAYELQGAARLVLASAGPVRIIDRSFSLTDGGGDQAEYPGPDYRRLADLSDAHPIEAVMRDWLASPGLIDPGYFGVKDWVLIDTARLTWLAERLQPLFTSLRPGVGEDQDRLIRKAQLVPYETSAYGQVFEDLEPWLQGLTKSNPLAAGLLRDLRGPESPFLAGSLQHWAGRFQGEHALEKANLVRWVPRTESAEFARLDPPAIDEILKRLDHEASRGTLGSRTYIEWFLDNARKARRGELAPFHVTLFVPDAALFEDQIKLTPRASVRNIFQEFLFPNYQRRYRWAADSGLGAYTQARWDHLSNAEPARAEDKRATLCVLWSVMIGSRLLFALLVIQGDATPWDFQFMRALPGQTRDLYSEAEFNESASPLAFSTYRQLASKTSEMADELEQPGLGERVARWKNRTYWLRGLHQRFSERRAGLRSLTPKQLEQLAVVESQLVAWRAIYTFYADAIYEVDCRMQDPKEQDCRDWSGHRMLLLQVGDDVDAHAHYVASREACLGTECTALLRNLRRQLSLRLGLSPRWQTAISSKSVDATTDTPAQKLEALRAQVVDYRNELYSVGGRPSVLGALIEIDPKADPASAAVVSPERLGTAVQAFYAIRGALLRLTEIASAQALAVPSEQRALVSYAAHKVIATYGAEILLRLRIMNFAPRALAEMEILVEHSSSRAQTELERIPGGATGWDRLASGDFLDLLQEFR